MKSSKYEPVGISSAHEIVHVFPNSEWHDTNHRGRCWCEPEWQDYSDEDGGICVIHNQLQ